ALYDINLAHIELVNKGKMPFKEDGAESFLKQVLKKKKLVATNDPAVVSKAAVVVVTLGTPVDEHLTPKVTEIFRVIKEIEPSLTDTQLLVLRSTLYPGITDKVSEYLKRKKKKTLVAFCPERIAEGRALTELYTLPQIVSGTSPKAIQEAKKLFK